MKHKKYIFLITFIVLFITTLTSCNTSKISYTAEISPPEKNNISLYGTWIVENTLVPLDFTESKPNTSSLLGTYLIFTKDKADINSSEYFNLNYKIKSVCAEDYFINSYKLNPKSINFRSDYIKVVTLSSENVFLNNFAFINEDSVVTSFNDILYYLKRVDDKETTETSKSKASQLIENISPTITSSLIQSDSMVEEEKDSLENNLTQSGILLGLKSYEKKDTETPYLINDNVMEPTYRTLWISFNGYYVNPVKEVPTILLPRKTGFWRIDVNRVLGNNYVQDYLSAIPLNSNSSTQKNSRPLYEDIEFNHLLDINFIGNDYLSLNYKGITLEKNETSYFNYEFMRMISIDTLYSNNETSIPIKKILGESGYTLLQEGAIAFLNSVDDKTKNSLNSSVDELSYGVTRENGQWILKGSLDIIDKAAKGTLCSFPIPMVPPRELVSFDTLYPSWLSIKEKVPEAVDAYSSPIENFVIILTDKKILLYSMENGVLSSSSLLEIDLKEGEIPVMSQWATGNYVDSWTETVNLLKNNLKD
ncbi:hypothetical protein [Clostridium grantii]|uniref:Lipoprotein n=1 Tax=Clostridium grantii DSM 8605 TaxID=1121316 RepID=A0A1M5XIA7_9CLOT|nr:hypothetical protein [Clostridium grantii]SHH99489.1 hypothetical protein SAMN02745207_03671 [Clostridium grantii DSM 8605]